MRARIIFEIEGEGGYVYKYAPLLLRDAAPDAVASLVKKQHDMRLEGFMEIYREELERAGLTIVEKPKDEVKVEETQSPSKRA